MPFKPPPPNGKGGANASGGGSAGSSIEAAEIMASGDRRAMQNHLQQLRRTPGIRFKPEHKWFFSLPRKGYDVATIVRKRASVSHPTKKIKMPEICKYNITLLGNAWGTVSIERDDKVPSKTTVTLTCTLLAEDKWTSLSGDSEVAEIEYYDFKFVDHFTQDRQGLTHFTINLLQFMTGLYCNEYSAPRRSYEWTNHTGNHTAASHFLPRQCPNGAADTAQYAVEISHTDTPEGKKNVIQCLRDFNLFLEYFMYNMTPDGKGARSPRAEAMRTPEDQVTRDNLYVIHAITRMLTPFAFLEGHDPVGSSTRQAQIHANEAMLCAGEAIAYLALPSEFKIASPADLSKEGKGKGKKKKKKWGGNPDDGLVYVMPGKGGGGAAADSAAQMMGLFIDKTLCFTQEMSEA